MNPIYRMWCFHTRLIWPGLILSEVSIRFVKFSLWWEIPAGVGITMLAVGWWRTHQLVTKELKEKP